jgi:hypothetical protein
MSNGERFYGHQFYVNRALETVVDPLGPPVVQNQLLDELKKCDHLVQLDWRYAQMVAGASKMPMNMIWVARNQDEPVSDTDLAALKDLAWNEIVKKRYLASVPGTSTVGDTAASMLEIVREMNLQRRRFQIMGLHEQVEASEIHLVLHLCQAGLIHTDRYRVMANRFRRHDKLFEAFGLAVGAFVCASAPFTLGAATTRYERDLQYEYKKNATALFVYVLQKNMGGMSVAELEEDYVARIARMIVVWPDEGSGKRRIGFKRGGKGGNDDGDDDDDKKDGGMGHSILDSVAVAQHSADKAIETVGKIALDVGVWRNDVDRGLDELKRFGQDAMEHLEHELRGEISAKNVEMLLDLNQRHDAWKHEAEMKAKMDASVVEQNIVTLRSQLNALELLWGRNPPAGNAGAPMQGVETFEVGALRQSIEGVQREIMSMRNGQDAQLWAGVKSKVDEIVDGAIGKSHQYFADLETARKTAFEAFQVQCLADIRELGERHTNQIRDLTQAIADAKAQALQEVEDKYSERWLAEWGKNAVRVVTDLTASNLLDNAKDELAKLREELQTLSREQVSKNAQIESIRSKLDTFEQTLTVIADTLDMRDDEMSDETDKSRHHKTTNVDLLRNEVEMLKAQVEEQKPYNAMDEVIVSRIEQIMSDLGRRYVDEMDVGERREYGLPRSPGRPVSAGKRAYEPVGTVTTLVTSIVESFINERYSAQNIKRFVDQEVQRLALLHPREPPPSAPADAAPVPRDIENRLRTLEDFMRQYNDSDNLDIDPMTVAEGARPERGDFSRQPPG